MKIKFILTVIIFLAALVIVYAQTVPQGINYQAVARDGSGNVLAGKTNMKIRFTILSASSSTLYSEEHTSIPTNQFGLFNLVIGQGTNLDLTKPFSGILWAGSHSLKMEIDTNGTSGYLDMGTVPFQSVPYALYSPSSAGPAGLNCWDLDGDGIKDTNEDINNDGIWDTKDCKGDSGIAGLPGAPGTAGTNGTNGYKSLIKTTSEPPGTNCAAGGQKIEAGLDANNNNALDAAEISNTFYACNGQTGSPGVPGNVSVVTGTAPIAITGTSNSPNIVITQANSTISGFLSNGDWNKFNKKMDSLKVNSPLIGYGTSANPLIIPYNTKTTDGVVLSPSGAANKMWATDAGGTPGWQVLPGAVTPVTASNGLTRVVNDIQLGGSLISNTSIAMGGYNFSMIGGNVGIGTATPSSQLHVYGSSDPFQITVENTGGAFKTGYGIKTATHEWFIGQTMPGNFDIKDVTNGQVRIKIDPLGNVGIGTLMPTHKLQIENITALASNSDGALQIYQNNFANDGNAIVAISNTDGTPLGSTYASAKLAGYSSVNSYGISDYGGWFHSIAGSGLIATWGSSATQYAIIGQSNYSGIFMGGNVGIGTTNPLTKLDVQTATNNAINGYTSDPLNGSSWGNGSNYAGIHGEGGLGNTQYQAGVYGYQIGSGDNSGGVVGAYSSATWGALGYRTGGSSYGGYFNGNVHVVGNLSCTGAKPFLIDHPLDPYNKYLYHFAIESPDVLNIYNGNISTDSKGDAIVTLPSYFSALNIDYKYQLTVIGQFAQAIIAEEINNNQFKIKTDKPNVKVSWQVAGIRNDKSIKRLKPEVEVDKPSDAKGKLLDPESYGILSESSNQEKKQVDKQPNENRIHKGENIRGGNLRKAERRK